MNHLLFGLSVILSALLISIQAAAAPERLAILGDSITYDGRWATLVESALRNTPDFADAEIVNLGLPSETVSGLSEAGHAGGAFPRPCLDERLARVLDAFKPTSVLACYGMNDGIYLPPDAERLKAYQDGMLKLKSAVEMQGGRIVFITPPLYDPDHPSPDPERYDAALDAQAAWLVSQAAPGFAVINIRPAMREAVAGLKKADPGFSYANDGVHPGDAGHMMIARSVAGGLWPLWNLPGKPEFAEGNALSILSERAGLLKLAWLTRTGHKRPGIPAGLPLDQANEQAERLMKRYLAETAVTHGTWNGYRKSDFKLHGRDALLVEPEVAAAGRPWIWRTEFFGHEPQADIALLDKGFHVAYIDMTNLYGAPVAMEIMDSYFKHVTGRYGLSQKPVLEGMSRGGLFAFNWAARRPGNVAGLYVDAPVCDFKSWPGGKGRGPGSPDDWQRLLKIYNLTEDQAMAYDKNPVDNLAPLAKAGIPIFAVIGAADEVVQVSENIDIVEKRYKKLGGTITVIRKPGGKHHPHSLVDPTPIVDFTVSASR